MAKIEEELVFAKQAKAAIEGELTEEAIKVLRDATRIAIEQVVFSGEEPLKDARNNIDASAAPNGRPSTRIPSLGPSNG